MFEELLAVELGTGEAILVASASSDEILKCTGSPYCERSSECHLEQYKDA